MKAQKLPRGIYYEPKRKRFRVRLYRNHAPFMGGYFPTLQLATAALRDLKLKIAVIPKLLRNQKETRQTYAPSIAGIFATIGDDLIRSPGSKRIGKK